jgi:hypothetical protein
MKLNQKLAIAFLAVGTGVFGLSSGAFAGSGGAAGSAAFTVTGDKVTGVAVSAAVGKDNAAASAFNSGGNNSAYALGSAGTISINNMGSGANNNNGFLNPTPSMTGSPDNARATAQNNDLTGTSSIKLGTTSGNTVVGIPTTP